jgi:uncharacterized protein (TIRG00374 family)
LYDYTAFVRRQSAKVSVLEFLMSAVSQTQENLTAESPAWSRWIGRAVFALTAIMCLYLAVTAWATHGDMIRAYTQLPSGILPKIIALVMLGWGLRALRWQYYVYLLHWQIPFHHSVMAFIASFAFTATPGKAGEIVKSMMLRTRHNTPLSEGVGVLIVERLGDLLAVMILAVGGLTLLSDAIVYFVISSVLVFGMTVFVCSRSIYTPIFLFIAKIPKLSGTAHKFLRLFETSRSLLRPFPFLLGVGIAVIAWGCEGWAFNILLQSLEVKTQFLTSCSIYGVATLVGALSALPGGVGSFEVVMILLLTRLGMSATAAAVPVIIFRFCSLWLGSFIGLIFMLVWLSVVAPKKPTSSGEIPMNDFLHIDKFESASIILPVINETVSLKQTVDIILRDAKERVKELIIVICKRTTPDSMAVIKDLQDQLGDLIVVLEQKLPFLGGALRDAIDVARGSHVIIMASDLETNPNEVRMLIDEAQKNPSAIVTTSRWIKGGEFHGYSKIKLICNWIFQHFFSVLYLTHLTDMTYGFRIFPTKLVQAIRWEEVRHPFNLESVVKPLRLGVKVIEVPSIWFARIEGESQNPFFRNFAYFPIGIKTRFCSKQSILKSHAGQCEQ